MSNKVITNSDGLAAVYGNLLSGLESDQKDAPAIPSDVTFVVGDSRTHCSAHRFIVSVHCETLNKMLNGRMKEASQKEVFLPFEGLICATEDDGCTFKTVLKFIYTGTVEFSTQNIVPLMQLCDFLQTKLLFDMGLSYMTKTIGNDTVCAYLECATRLNQSELLGTCKKYFTSNMGSIIDSDGITALSKDSFLKLLELKELNISEIKLFSAVVKWLNARNTSNEKDRKLKKDRKVLLSMIRFPIIDLKDLAKIVIPTKLVSNEVLVEAFAHQAIIDEIDAGQEEKLDERFKLRGGSYALASGEFGGSNLLSREQAGILIGFLGGVKPNVLLYKATTNGFTSQAFHAACDNKGPTIFIAKCKGNARIFGGYAVGSWTSNGAYHNDTTCKSFIYTMHDDTGKPAKYLIVSYQTSHSIFGHPSYGPTFGPNHNLHICTNANTTVGSYCTGGGSYYQNPTHTCITGSPNNYLIEDYEVYSVKK